MAISVGVVLLAVSALGTWWFFFNDDAPAEVSLDDALAGLSTATASAAGATATAVTTDAAPSATASGSGAEVTLEGAWQVDTTQDSFVGYRIDEELASVGAKTAVGRASEVSGTLEFDGASITAVSVAANLQNLASDDDRRDGQLRRQALETNDFPEATFVLTEPIVLESVPAEGETITATAVGDLTLHGVTNSVQLELQGQLVGGSVVVVGSTVILLADYDIEKPSAVSVLSVSDEATMELQLYFTKA